MSLGTKILIGLIVVVFCGVLGVGCACMSANNTCVAYEESINEQYTQNKNSYDNMFKKIKEVAQVPAMYTDDMKQVYKAVMTDRYGSNGSKAMWQWIKEHNPKIDSSIYKQIQQVIESGRNDFSTNQKMLISKKKEYKTYLRTFPSNVFASNLGFPEIDFNKFNIVTSDEVEKAFKDGKADYIKVRGE